MLLALELLYCSAVTNRVCIIPSYEPGPEPQCYLLNITEAHDDVVSMSAFMFRLLTDRPEPEIALNNSTGK